MAQWCKSFALSRRSFCKNLHIASALLLPQQNFHPVKTAKRLHIEGVASISRACEEQGTRKTAEKAPEMRKLLRLFAYQSTHSLTTLEICPREKRSFGPQQSLYRAYTSKLTHTWGCYVHRGMFFQRVDCSWAPNDDLVCPK
jgi:hypothetical protein